MNDRFFQRTPFLPSILLFHSFLICFSCFSVSFAQAEDRQLLDIRFYHFRSAESAAKFDTMMADAVLPVMKTEGVGPVGVFTVVDSTELNENARVVVVPFDSIEEMTDLRSAYADDPDFWPRAEEYLVQEPGDPAYDRVESMLLYGFTGMPRLVVPGSGEGKSRRFELRTYKSENEIQGLLKVKMFNDAEIELFEEVGLPAVFFGEALVASNLPQLTYMLVHDDEAKQGKAWKDFLAHPKWEALKNDEQFSSIRLKITKHLLSATEYSNIK